MILQEIRESIKRIYKRDPIVFWCGVVILVTGVLRIALMICG